MCSTSRVPTLARNRKRRVLRAKALCEPRNIAQLLARAPKPLAVDAADAAAKVVHGRSPPRLHEHGSRVTKNNNKFDNKVSKLIDQLKARTDEFTAATNKTMNAINPTETLVARMRAYGTAVSVGVFIGAAVTAGVLAGLASLAAMRAPQLKEARDEAKRLFQKFTVSGPAPPPTTATWQSASVPWSGSSARRAPRCRSGLPPSGSCVESRHELGFSGVPEI